MLISLKRDEGAHPNKIKAFQQESLGLLIKYVKVNSGTLDVNK